jgi:hypothetical protein
MAPKPKKMTDADKAELKKLQAGKGALANGKLSMDQQLALLGLQDKLIRSRSYSPAPMSAAAKAKAGARGKATQAKVTARKPKAGTSTVSKIVKRAKTVAREARDIPTAVGTAISGRNVQYGGGAFARKDLKTQIKEVGSAIKSGKKGTEAAQVRFASKKKGTVGSSGLDQNVSKMKAKRK